MDIATKNQFIEYLLRLADDQLIIGHRLSEWCGHAHILEEDLALANIALDCLGQANNLLKLVCTLENNGKTADDLAYFRDTVEFRNCLLVEQPNGDFAQTIVRQFLFDTYCYYLYETLQKSSDEQISAIAAKAIKEINYHLKHSSSWIIRLGDGTVESKTRTQKAFNNLWRFTEEMLDNDELSIDLANQKVIPTMKSIKPNWNQMIDEVLAKATLARPSANTFQNKGGRTGKHSEYLGYILAEMQIVARSHPRAKW